MPFKPSIWNGNVELDRLKADCLRPSRSVTLSRFWLKAWLVYVILQLVCNVKQCYMIILCKTCPISESPPFRSQPQIILDVVAGTTIPYLELYDFIVPCYFSSPYLQLPVRRSFSLNFSFFNPVRLTTFVFPSARNHLIFYCLLFRTRL